MINKFLDHLKIERNLSPNTVEAYRGDLALFDRYCKDIVKATQEDIVKFLKDLEKYSPRTRNRIVFSTLASFYSYLIRIGTISISPVKGLKRAKTATNEITILTAEEIDKMLKYIVGEDDIIKARNRLLINILTDTGARISEIVNLKISDIKGNSVKILGKGNKYRTAFISPATKRKLQALIEEFKVYGEYENIFINQKGQVVSRTTAYNIIKQTADLVGLEKQVSPHIFRHTFATTYLARGGTESGLRELLGWSDNKMLNIYRHISLEDLHNEYKKVMGGK
jgi:site-specific recombinase XerD